MIERERIKYLNDKKTKDNSFVVYWMQNSQRTKYNHALEYSISRANDLNKPLLVYFGITDQYPEANLRHYQFMIEGLKEVKEQLLKRNIKMIIRHISPELGAIEIAQQAVLMVVDCGYLKIEREWRQKVAQNINIPLVQVEANVVVPIEEVSLKEEYSARTIRSKIKNLIPFYTKPFYEEELENSSLQIKTEFKEFDLNDLSQLVIDRTITPSKRILGGTSSAERKLDLFIKSKLGKYAELKNDPSLDYQSQLSPYLHFGQISPVYIFHKVSNLNSEIFLEELIIRRELAINFVYYNNDYDNYQSIPEWAKKTLDNHVNDPRPHLYNLSQLENYQTHDVYWNAAQKEMVITGKMHGYMRMYWGKKIIEWTDNPGTAYQFMIYLNNKYSLDGRDPNGYAGIAWCFGKHDRPWREREIFGYVRYMNYKGLQRKFNIDLYVDKINNLSDNDS
ncbi:MAG: deoxyribodipyrimidine photo-lyase [Bacilli bacterium]|nr:deoxyribodipyrimidine photo-lyase [Bacilli bacterium]MDD4547606.1 deoxyribodipyrimidine photo-lyase [Bacilli bacterium]